MRPNRGISKMVLLLVLMVGAAESMAERADAQAAGQGTPQAAPQAAAPATPPSGASDDYAAERAKALALFNTQQDLEALPLFEDLAKKKPDDNVVLVGLAGCLVAHAATLADSDEAGKERVRAKELLEKAYALGNRSQLAQNMLDSLKTLPGNGQMTYAAKADVDAAMKTGEAAFARQDYDEAIKNYMHALELDPKNYYAALFVGDGYFSQKKFTEAGKWYDRAVQINPNIETAYRYHADMAIKQGDMDKARVLSVEAVVAEPYNPIPWRELIAWGNASHTQLRRIHVTTGSSVAPGAPGQTTVTINPSQGEDVSAVWIVYTGTRLEWQQHKFKETFPEESVYRHTLAEEADALTTAAKVAEERGALHPDGPVAKDENIQLLLRLYLAKMIEPYVLLGAADQGIARDYPSYREENRDKLEQYLETIVVQPGPATK